MKRFTLIIWMLAILGVASAQAPQAVAEVTQLDEVLDQGYVQVYTTGDYKPFTYYNPDTDTFQGIDIAMAHDLAEDLDVEVRFVHTSWSNLMADITSGKCDIAMGGISIKLERQVQAFFTEPYLVTGKTPITRCENVEAFQTLEQIDQPEVTVIVNPGGTNESFARETLDEAEILVYEDNVTIFNKIVDGTVDLMMTDAIETVVQANLHPELCAVHPDQPFTYVEFGYLLPRGDGVWKAWVDQWLHLTKARGEFDTIFDNALQ